ncbi:MAG: hypothetical protein MdMp014T_1237 [Treponematales bacterium]
MAHDSIPGGDSEFDLWFANLKTYVVNKTSGTPPEWTHIPQAKVSELAARQEAWHTAFLPMSGPHDPVATERKDDERDESETFLRPFIAQYLKFDPVTNADRTAMGVHNRDKVPSPHPIPSSVPDTDVRNTENHFEHRLSALNNEGKPLKPHDAYGVRFAWQVGGERPASGADLPKGRFSRRTSIVVPHGEALKGQTAYYSTCYENSKGEAGEWSPIVEAIIA